MVQRLQLLAFTNGKESEQELYKQQSKDMGYMQARMTKMEKQIKDSVLCHDDNFEDEELLRSD